MNLEYFDKNEKHLYYNSRIPRVKYNGKEYDMNLDGNGNLKLYSFEPLNYDSKPYKNDYDNNIAYITTVSVNDVEDINIYQLFAKYMDKLFPVYSFMYYDMQHIIISSNDYNSIKKLNFEYDEDDMLYIKKVPMDEIELYANVTNEYEIFKEKLNGNKLK